MRRPAAVLAVVLAGSLIAGCGFEPPRPDPDIRLPPPGQPRRDRSPEAEPDHGRPDGRLVPVIRVVDGDTVHVLRDGRDVTIRLIGIDTPEVDWYGGRAECFGAAAGRFLVGLLEGERVRLEFDEERIDPYGRTLAYLYTEDGRFVNAMLVRRGFATVTIYEPNDRYEAQLTNAEVGARSSGAGLWSACT